VLARQRAPRSGWCAGRVRAGAASIRAAFARLEARRRACDRRAIDDADLDAIGEACADLPLITAGSGVALGLPGFPSCRLLGDVDGCSSRRSMTGHTGGFVSKTRRSRGVRTPRWSRSIAAPRAPAGCTQALAAVEPALDVGRPFSSIQRRTARVAAVQQALGTDVAATRIGDFRAARARWWSAVSPARCCGQRPRGPSCEALGVGRWRSVRRSTRRTVDRDAERAALAGGAEVRQLRFRRLLLARTGDAGLTMDDRGACAGGRSLERGLTHGAFSNLSIRQ
jgi:hypothetical protein